MVPSSSEHAQEAQGEVDFSSSSREFLQVPGRKEEAAWRPEVTQRCAGQREGPACGPHAAGGRARLSLCTCASPCARLPALPAQLTRMKARSCRNEKWGSESLPSLPSALIFPPAADWCSKDPGLSSSSVMCGSLWKPLSHN